MMSPQLSAIALRSLAPADLAGDLSVPASPPLMCRRIRTLRDRYVNEAVLRDRLEDLPQQFIQPRIRPWGALPWRDVHPDQLVGLDRDTFCAILLGAINTEAPIRDYTQSSRQYLQPLYPAMARFVGGWVDERGNLQTVGLWEREEQRHTPALAKLYTQLSDRSPQLEPHTARPYQPAACDRENLYRHGLHRVATEYGATCLYLWLMAHSTGAVQTVLAELLIDEINHMTKFWGFGLWAYPDASALTLAQTLTRAWVKKLGDRTTQGSLLHTLRRMMTELAWERWHLTHRLTFVYTLDQVMKALWQWQQQLTPAYLDGLFGSQPSH